MIQAGYLADLRAIQMRLDDDRQGLHTRHGDFLDRELAGVLFAANAPEYVAKGYCEHADGRTALVFTPTVATARSMVAAFRAAGIAAYPIDGTTSLQVRRVLLGHLHNRDIRVLCNRAVFTEGCDEPMIDCIALARPPRSRPLYIQMIGWGTRLHLAKVDCVILDVVGATMRHGAVTAASLFAATPDAPAGQTLTKAVAARERQRAPELLLSVSGRLIAAPVDVFRRWNVTHVIADGQRINLAKALSLAYAPGMAEDHVQAQGGGGLTKPRAKWRQASACTGQLHHMCDLGIPATSGLTKGQAAHTIRIAQASRALHPRKGVYHG